MQELRARSIARRLCALTHFLSRAVCCRACSWGVDCIIAGSQKGLMVPAGLGFNILSPKALEARKALPGNVSAYW